MNLFLFTINASSKRREGCIPSSGQKQVGEKSGMVQILSSGSVGVLTTIAFFERKNIKDFLFNENKDVEKNAKEAKEVFKDLKELSWDEFHKLNGFLKNKKNCPFARVICTLFAKECLNSLKSDLEDFLKNGKFNEENEIHIGFYKITTMTIKSFINYIEIYNKEDGMLLHGAFVPFLDILSDSNISNNSHISQLDKEKVKRVISDINKCLGIVTILESTTTFLQKLSKIKEDNQEEEIVQHKLVTKSKIEIQVINNKIKEKVNVEAEKQLEALL